MNLDPPNPAYRSTEKSAFPKSPQIDFTVFFVDLAVLEVESYPKELVIS